jgi:hypothetical protein
MAFAFFVIPERQKLSGFFEGEARQLAKVWSKSRCPNHEVRSAGVLMSY